MPSNFLAIRKKWSCDTCLNFEFNSYQFISLPFQATDSDISWRPFLISRTSTVCVNRIALFIRCFPIGPRSFFIFSFISFHSPQFVLIYLWPFLFLSWLRIFFTHGQVRPLLLQNAGKKFFKFEKDLSAPTIVWRTPSFVPARSNCVETSNTCTNWATIVVAAKVILTLSAHRECRMP